VPRYVRFITEWPMSGTKIKKAILRDMIAADLKDKGITRAPRIETAPLARPGFRPESVLFLTGHALVPMTSRLLQPRFSDASTRRPTVEVSPYGRRERYPMSMRRTTAILLAVAVAAGLSIGAGRRAQRFLSELPIVDHNDAADGPAPSLISQHDLAPAPATGRSVVPGALKSGITPRRGCADRDAA
jgi:hypothetical protein